MTAVPGNPVFPAGNVQFDIAGDTRLGTAVGFFVPGNPVIPGGPCRRVAQLEVHPASIATEGPILVVAYDAQMGMPTLVPRSLTSSVPNVARCPASATTF